MSPAPTILIVSGGIGASAQQLLHTVLAQFPEDAVRVVTMANIRQPAQVEEVIRQAHDLDALIVYTLVDPALRDTLVHKAQEKQVQAVDLMSPIITWISEKLGKEPRAEPGLYRKLHREYFDRIAAIEFTMAHDDGKNRDGWPNAEAILVGVSRVGKTPLSLYLAVLGWKVANYPFIPQIPVPDELYALDPRRVFGLTIEPGQLLQFRMNRQKNLGAPVRSSYVDPQVVFEEVREARQAFRRGRFTIVDMTDKTIELAADEIMRRLASF